MQLSAYFIRLSGLGCRVARPTKQPKSYHIQTANYTSCVSQALEIYASSFPSQSLFTSEAQGDGKDKFQAVPNVTDHYSLAKKSV